MAYCPSCNAEIDATAPECPRCRALFGEVAAWKPTDIPSAVNSSPSVVYMVGRTLVWGGHFFLVGVPVLFVLYHLLLYRGGGTSGVPLAFSIMFSPILYVPGYLLAYLGRDKAV